MDILNRDKEQTSVVSEDEDATPVIKQDDEYSLTKPAGEANAYFDSLIREENFPGYEITRNVHVRTFDPSAHPCCFPITYLFSKNGKPVLAVLLMNTNQYRSMIARGSYQVLKDQKINFIRFFRSYDNEMNYVLNRIRENLF